MVPAPGVTTYMLAPKEIWLLNKAILKNERIDLYVGPDGEVKVKRGPYIVETNLANQAFKNWHRFCWPTIPVEGLKKGSHYVRGCDKVVNPVTEVTK